MQLAYTHIFLLGLLLTTIPSYAAESYDKMAHIQVLPNPPLFAKSTQECDRYAKRMQQLLADVETAHDACIRVETGKTFGQLPADGRNACSNPSCQGLHDARASYRKTGQENMARCSADVAEFQMKEQTEAAAKRERRLRDAQSNPCIKDWMQYEGLCVGTAANQADAKNCSTELARLRRSCPNSGR